MKKILVLLLALMLGLNLAFAGDFQDDLKKLASENATNYIAPAVTAFGTDMNAGLYHTALPHKLFGFDVGIRVMGAMVPDDALNYTFLLPDTFELEIPGYSGTVEMLTSSLYTNPDLNAPTVFGGEGHYISPNTSYLEQELYNSLGVPIGTFSQEELDSLGRLPVPSGIKIDPAIMPLVMPQVSVGLPMKSEVLIRYMPPVKMEDIGEITFLGLGLKHSISQYIPMCPVEIAAQGVYQQLKIGDILESTHTCFNVHASKKLSLLVLSLTPYVGLGMEKSNLKADYTIEGTGTWLDGTPVSFDLDGENSFRARVGITTRVLLFKINADYAFLGDYPAFTAGIMLSIL